MEVASCRTSYRLLSNLAEPVGKLTSLDEQWDKSVAANANGSFLDDRIRPNRIWRPEYNDRAAVLKTLLDHAAPLFATVYLPVPPYRQSIRLERMDNLDRDGSIKPTVAQEDVRHKVAG